MSLTSLSVLQGKKNDMKILIVASYLPFPLLNGGNIRLFNLIKELSSRHEITLICEKRIHQTQKDIDEVKKYCTKVVTFPRRKQWSVKNIFLSGLSQKSFLTTGHRLPDMTAGIEKELKESKYDVIHVETFYVQQNLPPTSLPVVLIEHNIEYLVYERYMRNAFPLLQPLLSLDIKKIKREEEQCWKQATVVATVSEEEKKYIKKDKVYVVPNGVDMKQFTLKKVPDNFEKKEKRILYIGDYKWIQNSDAASYIIKDVWPEIKKRLSTSRFEYYLWIVGRNMSVGLKKLGVDDSSIIFDDNNSDPTNKIFTYADVLLAPKRVGGGTSYKIIESMAVGTPVVTTPLGLEGLDIKASRDILVGDTPDELAEAVCTVLTNEEEYKRISARSRQAVEEKYAWPAITSRLEQAYKEALQK